MTHGLLLLGIFASACVFAAPGARADDCQQTTSSVIINGHIITQTSQVCSGDIASVSTEGGSEPPRDSGIDGICAVTAISTGQDVLAFCAVPPNSSPRS